MSWTRESDDGQHRGHEQGVDLEPDERAQDGEDAHDHDDVVDQRGDGGQAPIRKSRKRKVIQSMMPIAPISDEQERLLDELGAHDRADVGLDEHVVDRSELLLEGRAQLHELAALGAVAGSRTATHLPRPREPSNPTRPAIRRRPAIGGGRGCRRRRRPSWRPRSSRRRRMRRPMPKAQASGMAAGCSRASRCGDAEADSLGAADGLADGAGEGDGLAVGAAVAAGEPLAQASR